MKDKPDLLICENFFPGDKDVLLSVKVPKELVEALKRQTDERNQSLPDLVRSHLAYHVLADQLKDMVAEGMPLDTEDKSILESFRTYTENLLGACQGVESVRRHAKGLRNISREMESLIEHRVSKVMNETLDRLRKEHEENELRRRRRRAAGLTGPETPLPHKVKENELTPIQKRQRELAEVKDG